VNTRDIKVVIIKRMIYQFARAEFPQNIYRACIFIQTIGNNNHTGIRTLCIKTESCYGSSKGESWPATVAVPDSADSCRIWAWPNQRVTTPILR